MQAKYAIIGAGVAGCNIAWQLHFLNASILLIDNSAQNTCSIHAAGLINPLVPRGLRPTWLRDEIWNSIENYYAHIESKIYQTLLHKLPLTQIIWNSAMQREWTKLAKKPNTSKWVTQLENNILFELKNVYQLNVPLLLSETQNYFKKNNCFFETEIKHNELHFDGKFWHIPHIGQAQHLIFAEGWQGEQNPFFNYLPFKNSSGAIAKVNIKHNFKAKEAIKYKKWAIPIQEQYLVGSTFNHGDYNLAATEQEEKELLDDILSWAKNATIENIQKGIRPTVADRRPFIGTHPTQQNLHIFNGFGTKACSLCVHLAPQFARHLEFAETINPEANINRFNE